MKKRKFQKNHRKRNFLIQSFILLFLFVGIGYATLSTSLHLGGTLGVKSAFCEPDGSLYKVLECAAKNHDLGKEYTGAHNDSMDPSLSTEKIYHWYATTDEEGEEIQNRNNVIFANQCWQMIRTTDTGGVKMIYNGEPENGQCLDTRGNHVGLGPVGAMYAKGYIGDSYTYNPETQLFSLTGNIGFMGWTTATEEEKRSMIGRYVCGDEMEPADACTSLKYIYGYYGSSQAYGITIGLNSPYYQYGKSSYDSDIYSPGTVPTHVGYKTAENYNNISAISPDSTSLLNIITPSTTYYFADGYDYSLNSSGRYQYTLTDPYLVSSESNFYTLKGKYTLISTNPNYSSYSIYYIVEAKSSIMYAILLSNGNPVSYYDTVYYYGDSYTDLGGGTYSIDSPSTFSVTGYPSVSSSLSGKYLCIKNGNDPTCQGIQRVTSANRYSFYAVSSTNTYKYSNSFHYDETTGQYILDDNGSYLIWEFPWQQDDISNARYTCKNSSGVCNVLYYIYAHHTSNYSNDFFDMIALYKGENITEAVDSIFNSNALDAPIKTEVELWYEHNMLDYNNYIEDVIYCNDRNLLDIVGLDPNNPLGDYFLFLKEYTPTTDLYCSRVEDRFSVSNTQAQTKYKTGLMTSPEMNLLNNSKARSTGSEYWLMSGASAAGYETYRTRTHVQSVKANGDLGFKSTSNSNAGLRPAISLVRGFLYDSGNGSKESPYIVYLPG